MKNIFTKYMKKKDPDKAHAELSASGSERWLGCPGSRRLSRGIISKDSDAGIRGTNTHTLLQFILENHDWQKLLKTVDGACFKASIRYDGAMLSNALFAAEYVSAESIRMLKIYGEDPELYVEQKLKLNGVGFGTSDVILYHPFGLLHVMDYKNGVKAVEPTGNTQMLYYAHAAADKFNWEFSELHVTVIQPNAAHREGHIRTWKTDHETLSRAGLMLERGARRTEKPNAPLVKNDKWCWFCPARQICPKQMEIHEVKLIERFSKCPS